MSPASLLTLGILICFSATSQCQDLNSFLKKHIVQDNDSIVCDEIIKARNIILNNNCKSKNTFIHDTDGHRVKAMCANITKSTKVASDIPFNLTDCILKSESLPPPNCAYNQKNEKGKIYITCENHYPVHFDKFLLSGFGVSWTPAILMVVIPILPSLFL
uniref:Ribonuclease A-domain domain-containing protein n=1 Tax=Leptobrachium leishanense TaxID=445787 RepID=A0A8C5WJ98_9ANUR